MIKNIIITVLFSIIINTTITAQVRTPALSPSAKIRQTVGLTDIEIEYSRPSARERKIFGNDGLIPYDKIWRTGANAASKITVSDDITVAGKSLKKGTYAILSKPGTTSWTIHFFPYESSNWTSYVEKEPAIIATGNSTKTSEKIETFMMYLDHISINGAQLILAWENTKVSLPIRVEVEKRVMANIEKVMNGPSDGDYFRAALYMHEAKIDLNKALMYVQKVTNGNNPRFFQVYREALILADLDRKAEAIVAAKKSLELSKKAGNEDFVRLNQKFIKQWSK